MLFRSDDPQAVETAANVLKKGGIILYPTDTLYGLGVDALSDEAVSKLYRIKARDERKPVHAIVSDLDMAARYAYVDDVARKLAKKFLPGPMSLILKKRADVATGIAKHMETFGIRIPKQQFCLELARAFGRPITTTSANLSGHTPMRTVRGILSQIGEQHIDVAIDAGEIEASVPSTIVDLSGERPVILREGAIAAHDIWEELVQLAD